MLTSGYIPAGNFPGDGEALPSLIRAGQLISGQHILPSRHCGHVVQYEDELDKN